MANDDDIFNVIARRDANTRKTVAMKTVTLWAIHYGQGGRATSKLYPYAKARKLVARAKRLGLDVYIAGSVRVRVAK